MLVRVGPRAVGVAGGATVRVAGGVDVGRGDGGWVGPGAGAVGVAPRGAVVGVAAPGGTTLGGIGLAGGAGSGRPGDGWTEETVGVPVGPTPPPGADVDGVATNPTGVVVVAGSADFSVDAAGVGDATRGGVPLGGMRSVPPPVEVEVPGSGAMPLLLPGRGGAHHGGAGVSVGAMARAVPGGTAAPGRRSPDRGVAIAVRLPEGASGGAVADSAGATAARGG
jgi:hypothetical protein